MRKSAKHFIAVCVTLALFAALTETANAQTKEATLVPFAYVRSLSVVPASLITPSDPPLAPAPPATQKKQLAKWKSQKSTREATIRLRNAALASFSKSFASVLGTSGLQINLVPADETTLSIAQALNMAARLRASESISRDFSAAAIDKLTAIGKEQKVDACLVLSVDRFGINTGFQREIWVRACAWLLTFRRSEKGELLGPFYALGQANARRKLIGKGFSRDDDMLIEEAAGLAAQRLKKVLGTGRLPLFSEDSRYAVLPASLPVRVMKQFLASSEQAEGNSSGNPATSVIASSSIYRQRDVLFQPDTSPACQPIDQGAVQDALTCFSLVPGDFWTKSGVPDAEHMKAVGTYLKCRYVFASRATGIDCVETPVLVKDGVELKEGVDIRVDAEVEGLLFDVQEGKVIWKDRLSGGTIARTEYVRHKPRIRTDEQCISDAVRTAFAYLRSSFDEYRRKLDRFP